LLGTPSKRLMASIERIDDIARLEKLLKQIHNVATWKELLAIK
jgi:hypothetical protein